MALNKINNKIGDLLILSKDICFLFSVKKDEKLTVYDEQISSTPQSVFVVKEIIENEDILIYLGKEKKKEFYGLHKVFCRGTVLFLMEIDLNGFEKIKNTS